MNATTTDFAAREHQNRGCDWSKVWDCCESTVFLVLDEEGNNVAGGRVRHFSGLQWLYMDDCDGYGMVGEDAVARLILKVEE